jgi:alginate O-acetyltransferase complex protein AlgJ
VPEKLAVYADLFPGGIVASRPRPALRLVQEAELPLVYPLDDLAAARSEYDTYMLTDSHLTPRGNLLLTRAVLRAFDVGAGALGEVEDVPATQLVSGDLGAHFDPPVLEPVAAMAGASRAQVVSDNWPQIAELGGHIGTLRVFRQQDPPDERKLVVFGDSYAFGDEAYRGLSWFLAQVFREVHFVWAPFGWDASFLDAVGADLAVCQTAERFVGRVPLPSIDVRALADETLSRHRALGDDRLFSA